MNALLPTRPTLRWHGGKWKLAPWIIQHLPPHHIYVEPYGGAASVLLRKPRAYAEIYNDLDNGVVNLFRVLRDPVQADELIRRLALTPFARVEFDLAFEDCAEPLEQARRLIVRSFFSGGSRGTLKIERVNAGFNGGTARARGDNPQRSHAWDWRSFPASLQATIKRFAGVVIENRDAIEIMSKNDSLNTLHFVDPPYLPETRVRRADRIYRHEMSDADHVALLDYLQCLSGMVVLCGYPSALYDDALPGWRKVTRAAHADGARPRTECLWINPAASAQLHGDLLAECTP